MSTALQILHGSIVGGTGALLSYWAGWRARGDVMRIRGGVLGRPPLIFNEGPTQRGNGNGGPGFAELLMPLSRDQDPDWRRSFNHENTKRPSGPPPLRLRRSNPFVSEFQQQINNALNLDGHQPRPSRPGANPPPSEP